MRYETSRLTSVQHSPPRTLSTSLKKKRKLRKKNKKKNKMSLDMRLSESNISGKSWSW